MAEVKTKKLTLNELTSHKVAESIVSSGEEFASQIINSLEFHHGKLSEDAKTQLYKKLEKWLEQKAFEFTLD